VSLSKQERGPAPAPLRKALEAGIGSAGRDDRIYLAGREKIENSCANEAKLRDNYFNIGGLAFWDGVGRMDGKDQFEAEATESVSQPEYFALQKLVNRALFRSPIRHDTIR
jgi:hypothetical protein